MSKRFLHLVRMDVAHDHEATFNEVYDKEHVPLLSAVPGWAGPRAIATRRPPIPAIIAAYELGEPGRAPERAVEDGGGERPLANGDPASHHEPPDRHLRVGRVAARR